VSGLAVSEEKNTDPTTDFSSTSMPAFWQACLTMAWVFCRGRIDRGLVDELQRLAVLGANAVAPFFQPAASRIWLAFSMLNSNLVFFDRKRSGLLRKFAVAKPVRP
jgi:hypothetical protein